ncbi:HK97 gp10 family phage protein [Tomitella gaofuii]|uniref:HK97 gp10 family phage protein n=1 Tax=Tomitella gaofuii TaxID=2760083 RepID=UPI002E28E7CA|nr:HK97 gp10 family phage protein [Tomitella gaofuii]
MTGTFRLDRQALANETAKPLARTMSAVLRQITAQAKMNAPVKTGNLRRMIEPEPVRVQDATRLRGVVAANTEYAAAVHNGSKPHVIRPRRASVLAFKMGGKQVFAKSVQHPGTRGRPFLANAAEKVMERY